VTRETADAPLYVIRKALPCRIIERTNRFVVNIEIERKVCRAHINNTGRLHEMLITGRKGFCFETPNTAKTDFRLFAVEEGNCGALIDTQIQMKALGLYFNPADSFLYLYNPDLDVVIGRDRKFLY
jgi:DNA-binding sugar fermentation-stimulating protein